MNTIGNKGRKDGYRVGMNHGYYLGRCESIRRQIPEPTKVQWNIRLLYVTSGLGNPYHPMDLAIIDSLKGCVREVITTLPDHNVASQAALLNPDMVLVLNGMAFPLEQVDAIRAEGIKTAIWFTDDPYYTDVTTQIAPHYDFIFTLELNCIPLYQELGCKQVHYLPFAVDTKDYHPKYVEPFYRKDICFIGTAYSNRLAFIDVVAPFLSTKSVHISGWWWDRLANYALLAGKIALNDWMTPEKTASFYMGSKIVLNMHRSIDEESWNSNHIKVPAQSVNPRTFEISGCGTFQLTDIREDITRWYKPGEEIATYSSPEEMIHMIQYYLSHENERREIAWNGLKRTLQEHTYPARIKQLLTIILGEEGIIN